jgi:UTP--glucose-1-phosphate uridylyltransferase
MCAQGQQLAQQKMRDDHAEESAIDVFAPYHRQVEAGATGLIGEREIRPLLDVPSAADHEPPRTTDHLARTVLIRLNGGLATSMGMGRARSLLPTRGSRTFLDLIAHQVQHAGTDVRIHGALDLEDAGTPQLTGDSVDLGDRWP